MKKALRILIPLVRDIARALARRDYERELQQLRKRRESSVAQGKLPFGDD